MKRGDFATIAIAGDFGKPRPILVIQSDRFMETGTLTVLLVTATLVDAPIVRLMVQPTAKNGLQKSSQIMIDKAMTVRRDKCGPPFGRLEDDMMTSVTRSLAVFLGIA